MANNKNVYQQKENVSIPKKQLLEISKDIYLDETDLRVLLVLLTELDGFDDTIHARGPVKEDPMNYKLIQPEVISDTLDIKNKEVKRSIKHLLKADILQKGDSETVRGGYRFTF